MRLRRKAVETICLANVNEILPLRLGGIVVLLLLCEVIKKWRWTTSRVIMGYCSDI